MKKKDIFTDQMGKAIYIWPEDRYIYKTREDGGHKINLRNIAPKRHDIKDIIKNTFITFNNNG